MAKVKRTGRPMSIPSLGVTAADGDVVDVPAKVARELAGRDGWSTATPPAKTSSKDDDKEND